MNVQELIVTAVLPSPFTTTIKKNDRITRINNQPAADFYMDAISHETSYEYEGISASGERFHISCPVPLAVKLTPSADFMLSKIKQGDFEWSYFEQFWEQDQWEHLTQAMAAIRTHPIIVWIMKHIFRRDIDSTVELLFKGILHAQAGEHAAARSLIHNFMQDAMHSYTTNFHAIAYFYAGLLEDDTEQRSYWFDEAHFFNKGHSEKISQYLATQGYHHDHEEPSNHLHDMPFPIDLTLENLYRPNVTSLKTIIHAGKYALTPICVMPSYRANGPYYETLEVYQQMWPYFKNHLNPMIVLADEDDNTDFSNYWLGAERKVIAANIPLTVMLDPENHASRALGLSGSPTLFVIDPEGNIVQEGLSDHIDYWQLINHTNQMTASLSADAR